MKQVRAREYVKPRIESYRSREVVESLGTAEGINVSFVLPDDDVDDAC